LAVKEQERTMQGILDSPLLVITIAFLASALVAVILSLLVLLPPVRRLGRRSVGAQAGVIAACALLALVVTFGLGTRLFAGAMFAYVTEVEASWRDQVPEGSELEGQLQAWDESSRVIMNELWLRQVAPPTQGLPCYTKRFAVCELMGEMGVFGTSTWASYALFLGLSAAAALVAGVLAWFFLQRVPRRNSGVFV
jgi:ABC-type polysaccharide/polyol phosphate export permease